MSKWVMPLAKYKYGPLFGVVDSWHPNGHRGTDYNGFGKGTKLFAVNDGKIVVNKWSDGLGNVVVLQVGKNFFGYCHLESASPLKVGTVVKSGDVIGIAGTTGKFSSGIHLHLTLGLTKDAVFAGKVYDADKFLKKAIAAQKAAPAEVPAAAVPAAPAEAPAAPAAVAEPAAPTQIAKPPLIGELKKGSTGLAVKYLQQELDLPVDGIFGDITHSAVVLFQHKHPEITKPDGVVGKITWKALG